jgi:hypothetical protein
MNLALDAHYDLAIVVSPRLLSGAAKVLSAARVRDFDPVRPKDRKSAI